MKRMLTVVLLIALCHIVKAGDDKKIVSSTLKSAIVYRSGAELTHIAKVSVEQGNNELVIDGVSNKLDINSLQIGSNGNLTILSVVTYVDYLKPAVKSATVRRLEDSAELLNNEIDRIQTILKTNQELLELLKSNKTIGGSQTGLSVTELTKMVEYYKSKTLELNQEIILYKGKEAKAIAQHAKIVQQIKEEEQKNVKTSGRIGLQVYSPVSTNLDLTISYLTPTAYWVPAYDLKVENIMKPIQLFYKAKLVQTSGIDWQQVKLSLSTSMPSQRSNAPELKTWFLTYVNPEYAYYKQNKSAADLSTGWGPGNLDEVVVVGYGTQRNFAGEDKEKDFVEPLYVVNGNVVTTAEFKKINKKAIKTINTLKDAAATSIYGSRASGGAVVVTLKEELGDYVSIIDNQLNVVFDIDLPYDIPSNGKEQNVILKEFKMPVNYNYFTAPHMDKDAYLLGEMPDWESLNLLPGEANIIFEGTYIGKTHIDPASTDDTLHLTLGRDKRVVVTRETIKEFSSVKFLGSNKKQTFTYEITIRNNKKEKIQMTLKDQFPLSSNKEIEVELIQHDGAQVNGESGVLTWKPELAPGETKKYRVSYSVKFPKDKSLNWGK
jgi:TonB-dependent SusC/RagA subfamily outer membrane receptor